jgi:hypothetical protein
MRRIGIDVKFHVVSAVRQLVSISKSVADSTIHQAEAETT